MLAAPLFALTACETTNSDEWTGGATTPFAQAERSCREQLEFVSEEENRREVFIGCMAALGWQPRAGASIDL
ncbi:hypothetical protein [Qipengyuania sp. MTN3-11]|uniref:hypothetical protein n=1 Tax=Qipengyuania sp. MTN3-11 TaxID=3056557 RepID=UPI0036F4098F